MSKRYTVAVQKRHWEALHEAAKATGKTLADVVDSVMSGTAYLAEVDADAPPPPPKKVLRLRIVSMRREGDRVIATVK